jgi:hypothetical protein
MKGMGSIIRINSNAIAKLTSIGALDITADTIESTTLDSPDNHREFEQGLIDAGEVAVAGYFLSSDTDGQIAVYNALNTGGVIPFEVIFPSAMGASWDFDGIVTGFKTDIAMEDKIAFEATIKVTGKPVLGLTASTGLSALTLTGAGGALTPTFANGTYLYAYAGVTATSFTVTATAASHTLTLYVDGVLTQTLTTASASSAIAIAAGQAKKLIILAQESGKVAKRYEITVSKSA